jgi:hypothetical protein
MSARAFPLGAVLSVTTGVLLGPIEDLYRIVDYMTGDSITTIGLLAAGPPCKAALLHQHPHLADIDSEHVDGTNWRAFLAEQVARFGEALPVTPLDGWKRRDAMDDIETALRVRANARPTSTEINDRRIAR